MRLSLSFFVSLDIRFRTFGFDVILQWRQNMCCVIFRVWVSHEGKYCTKFLNHYSFICSKFYKLYKYNINMKPARPWMLAHLKIIWQFHAHPVHQKVSRFFGPRYIGDDLFLRQNLVSFNPAVVPLLELSFLAKSQKLTSA